MLHAFEPEAVGPWSSARHLPGTGAPLIEAEAGPAVPHSLRTLNLQSNFIGKSGCLSLPEGGGVGQPLFLVFTTHYISFGRHREGVEARVYSRCTKSSFGLHHHDRQPHHNLSFSAGKSATNGPSGKKSCSPTPRSPLSGATLKFTAHWKSRAPSTIERWRSRPGRQTSGCWRSQPPSRRTRNRRHHRESGRHRQRIYCRS